MTTKVIPGCEPPQAHLDDNHIGIFGEDLDLTPEDAGDPIGHRPSLRTVHADISLTGVAPCRDR